jgi:hypothetical protein
MPVYNQQYQHMWLTAMERWEFLTYCLQIVDDARLFGAPAHEACGIGLHLVE